MERNTKKGYAYWAYLLPPRLVPLKFFQDFADGTSSDYRYMIYPTMSFTTQPSLPLKISLCHDAFAKVRNKLEIKKEKGEKFENNVGMKIFLPKSLQLSEKLLIFATSNVCLTIRVSFPRGQDYIDTTHFKRVASATLFILETSS